LPASRVTVNGQPAVSYQDFTFASSNGLALADGLNRFTNIAWNYYGTLGVTNTVTAALPAAVGLKLDANGNLTNDGVKVFGYDAENQLTNVTVAGQWREDFGYDGLNRRRITRQYRWDGGTTAWALTNEVRFIYDGNVVMQEWDSNNVATVSYTRGSDLSGSRQGAGGIGGLLARQSTLNAQPSTVYYHADGNGNITALMDGSQYVVGRYLYDPFGRLLGKWGAQADANVYRFSSKEWDGNAGVYYYLYRFYEPNLQRWVNRDPIQEEGGINLYGFVNNNPINFFDPLGLAEIDTMPNGRTVITVKKCEIVFYIGHGNSRDPVFLFPKGPCPSAAGALSCYAGYINDQIRRNGTVIPGAPDMSKPGENDWGGTVKQEDVIWGMAKEAMMKSIPSLVNSMLKTACCKSVTVTVISFGNQSSQTFTSPITSFKR